MNANNPETPKHPSQQGKMGSLQPWSTHTLCINRTPRHPKKWGNWEAYNPGVTQEPPCCLAEWKSLSQTSPLPVNPAPVDHGQSAVRCEDLPARCTMCLDSLLSTLCNSAAGTHWAEFSATAAPYSCSKHKPSKRLNMQQESVGSIWTKARARIATAWLLMLHAIE